MSLSSIKNNPVDVEHRVSVSCRGLTGYGKAKYILEVMDVLKEKDYNARYKINDPDTSVESVTFIWKTKDVIL